MKKLFLLILFTFLFVNKSTAQDWRTIHTFEGSGIKKTAPFTINSTEWRITYESKATMAEDMGGAGHIFQLYLLEPGQSMFMGEILANQVNKVFIEGNSYVYKKGRFYFESNSANGDWIIKVQIKD